MDSPKGEKPFAEIVLPVYELFRKGAQATLKGMRDIPELHSPEAESLALAYLTSMSMLRLLAQYCNPDSPQSTFRTEPPPRPNKAEMKGSRKLLCCPLG